MNGRSTDYLRTRDDYTRDEWEQERESRYRPASRSGVISPWAVAGLAVVGLGVAAWMYFGPDFKRYLKMRGM